MVKKDFLIGLSNNKGVLKQFVSVISENDIHRRIKNFWTIYEHIDHLVVTQKLLLGRIEQFIVEENPIIKPYVPEDKPIVEDSKKTVKELVEEFIKLRNLQIGLIKKAKRSVWQKEGTHPEYSKYSFEILIRHVLLHDSVHMWRIEELWIEKEELIQELK